MRFAVVWAIILGCGGDKRDPEQPMMKWTPDEQIVLQDEQLESARPEEAARVAALLAMTRDDILANRETVEASLADPSGEVRAAAAAALAYTARDRESIPALAAALTQEQDPAVVRRLVAALMSFSDSHAVDAVVRKYLAGVDPTVEADIIDALRGADPRMVEGALATWSGTAPLRAETLHQALR